MRYRRVLLLRPASDGRYRAYLPTGLGWVAEALEAAGVTVRVLDFDLPRGPHDLEDALEDFRPDLVAMGMTSYRSRRSLELLARCRRPDGPALMLGGPHVSAFGAALFRDAPWLDWALLGEGERALPDLCRGEEPASIPGLFRKVDGELRSRPPAWIDDLDDLAFPRYGAFELDAYPGSIVGLVTSRGCPHGCLFCNVATSMGRRLRLRSAASVAGEVAWWMARGRRVFSVLDDGFTERREHAMAVCDALEVHGRAGARFLCGNGLRADRVDGPLLRRMAEAGFEAVAFGAESGDPAVRRRLGKPAELGSLKRAVHEARGAGLAVKLHFVVGGPGETERSFERSMALAWTLPVDDASFNNLVPYPGTPLETLARREGWIVAEDRSYLDVAAYHGDEPVLATAEFDRSARRRALRRGRRMAACIRRRSLERRLRPRWGPLAPFLAALAAWEPLVHHLRSDPGRKGWALSLARLVGLR